MHENEKEHPAAACAAALGIVRRRARQATTVLALDAVATLLHIAVLQWQLHCDSTSQLELSVTAAQVAAWARAVLLAVTAVVYVRWLYATKCVARTLGGDVPRLELWGIPWVRPFSDVNLLMRVLAPRRVPPPAVRVVAPDEKTAYRETRVKEPPPQERSRLRLVLTLVVMMLGIVLASCQGAGEWSPFVIELVAALLGINVMHELTARLVERYRRIRYTPVEELTRLGIKLGTSS